MYRNSPKASVNLPSSPGKRRSRKRDGGGSGNDKTFTVSTRSCPLDTGYSWSKAGAEPIEKIRRYEICRPRSYPSGSGPGRQDQNGRQYNNIIKMNRYFNFKRHEYLAIRNYIPLVV